MKNGKTIVELANEIQRQSEAKKDFIADTREMNFTHDDVDDKFVVDVPKQGSFDITPHAHRQIAGRMNVPFKYYERMMHDAPDLLVSNIRHWMDNEPKRQMVRTLDNNARAILSDRYRRIDNEQIAEAVLPALLESNSGIEVMSSEITDNRMYIQARLPKLEGEVKKGDVVQHGMIITNSEIGSGSLIIKPMIYRLVCTNGMVTGSEFSEGRMRKSHLGRQTSVGEDYTIYTDETMQADDHALMLKIRDSIKNLSDPELFAKLMEQMKASAEGRIIDNPFEAVEELGKAFSFQKSEQESVLENLIADHDYSKWGMLNAVTKVANDTKSYDRAIELETIGGQILEMSDRNWKNIAEVA